MRKHQDEAQIFLIYMALVGDAEKTALALDLETKDVRNLAEKHGWAEKVRRLSVMSKSGSPGDWERAQNRALNFVQCHQLRRQIDRLIAELSSEDYAVGKLIVFVGGQNVRVPELSAKFLKDLADAMTKIHDMTYAALGDTPKERTERGPLGENPVQQQGLHAALITALNATKDKALPPAQTLVDGAVDVVTSVREEVSQPVPSAPPAA